MACGPGLRPRLAGAIILSALSPSLPRPTAEAGPRASSPKITRHRRPAARFFSPSWWRERDRRKSIDRLCRGYSTERHWSFFRRLLARPEVKRCLVLGVYYGRDIAYMSAILQLLGRSAEIVGVDKFDDTPGEDWPSTLRQSTWREAGFGPPPDIESARENLARLGFASHVRLHQGRAEDYLGTADGSFDFVYVDTSHDYATTRKTIHLAVPRLERGGVIGGDDFSDQGTWGVASAVADSFSRFELFSRWIWLARGEDYQLVSSS
jgi:methyltransferase family protein